jgi:hypothetical protein
MKRVLSLLITMLVLAAPTFAATFGVNFASPGSQNSSSLWSLGYQFVANNASVVTGLGTFDYNQDGLVGPQHVGLWNGAGTLLADTYVTNADALQGFWRFHDIPGVALTPGAN